MKTINIKLKLALSMLSFFLVGNLLNAASFISFNEISKNGITIQGTLIPIEGKGFIILSPEEFEARMALFVIPMKDKESDDDKNKSDGTLVSQPGIQPEGSVSGSQGSTNPPNPPGGGGGGSNFFRNIMTGMVAAAPTALTVAKIAAVTTAIVAATLLVKKYGTIALQVVGTGALVYCGVPPVQALGIMVALTSPVGISVVQSAASRFISWFFPAIRGGQTALTASALAPSSPVFGSVVSGFASMAPSILSSLPSFSSRPDFASHSGPSPIAAPAY